MFVSRQRHSNNRNFAAPRRRLLVTAENRGPASHAAGWMKVWLVGRIFGLNREFREGRSDYRISGVDQFGSGEQISGDGTGIFGGKTGQKNQRCSPKRARSFSQSSEVAASFESSGKRFDWPTRLKNASIPASRLSLVGVFPWHLLAQVRPG